MNWVRAVAGVLVLWSSTAGGATLTWNANSEPDLAGYRVYHCSQQPCTRASGKASLLVTLGKVTSFNIGTPAVTQYYIITAYDFANHESSSSNLATFTPVGSPPPPPPPAGRVSLEVVGNPATGPWGVEGAITDPRNVMATRCAWMGSCIMSNTPRPMASLTTTARRPRPRCSALARIRWSSCFMWKAPRPRSGGPA